jgi:hypothetical protein
MDIFQRAEKELLSNIPTDSGFDNSENIRYRLFEEMGLEYVDRKTVVDSSGQMGAIAKCL